MIPRYSLPQMSAVWQDESKFNKFLEIEVLTCEAYAKLGKIPKEAARKIRRQAKFDLKRVNKLEETTQHDVVAFVSCVGNLWALMLNICISGSPPATF